MIDETILAKPKKVATAINLSYVAFGIGLINSYVFLLGLESTTQQKIKPILIAVLTQAFLYFLITQINAGKKWARTISLVSFVFGGISTFLTMDRFLEGDLLTELISFVIGILQLSALILLYSKEGNAWFNLKNAPLT
ncbi:hypothetical protein [Spirosoma endophyticum]|uniref:Uncharacterized protein n=1 Tax=Spirosoma endophyticum TaxID=662367 RepID=A0A1I2HPI3_9BACT|nr:hypothetical protein [Spirosoma endophyticum]SFF31343.1 hypothetical protein SAMN05216167_14612 [Spirosoma endophyticum]